MRGYLSLEPDAATRARLLAFQKRLRDALARQGVSFPDRLGAPLLAWPFATLDEIDEAARAVAPRPAPVLTLGTLRGFPNDDRPAEIGFALSGAEGLQAELFGLLRGPLDPDPPKVAAIRLVRVSPPSRKVGAAMRGAGLLGAGGELFVPDALAIWNQTPQGFEIRRTMAFGHGGS